MELKPGFLDDIDPEDHHIFLDPQPESQANIELFKTINRKKTFIEKLSEIFGAVFA